MSEAEEILFQDHEVTITKQDARFGAASFPIAGLSGVFVRPPRTGRLMAVAIVLLAFAILNAHGEAAIPAFIVAAAIMIFAYVSPSSLVLRTGAGDRRALASRNRRRLLDIKAAIERAMPPRG